MEQAHKVAEIQKIPDIILYPDGPYEHGDIVTASWTITNERSDTCNDVKIRISNDTGIEILKDTWKVDFAKENSNEKIGEEDWVELKPIASGESITATVDFTINESAKDGLKIYFSIIGMYDVEEIVECEIKLNLKSKLLCSGLSIKNNEENEDVIEISTTLENDGYKEAKNINVFFRLPNEFSKDDLKIDSESEWKYNETENKVETTLQHLDPKSSFDFSVVLNFADAKSTENTFLIDGIIKSENDDIYLEPLEVNLKKKADFKKSSLTIGKNKILSSEELNTVEVRVYNNGYESAYSINIHVKLPEQISYIEDSLTINNTKSQEKVALDKLILNEIHSKEEVFIRFLVSIRTPITNESKAKILLEINNVEIEQKEITILSEASFDKESNRLWVEGGKFLKPHLNKIIKVQVCNTGTDVAQNVRLRFEAGDITFHKATVFNEQEQKEININTILGNDGHINWLFNLGAIQPNVKILIEIQIQGPETFEDGTQFNLIYWLKHDKATEKKISEVAIIGRSTARISSESWMRSQKDDVLRRGQTRNFTIHLYNDSTSEARNVRVYPNFPKSINIEKVSGAKLDSNNEILFEAITAQGTSEATLTTRIIGPLERTGQIKINPKVSIEGLGTRYLSVITLQTIAQALIDNPHVSVTPNKNSQEIYDEVELTFENVGDSLADRIKIMSPVDDYYKESTSVNKNPINDINGNSPLVLGLGIGAVRPEEKVTISYKAIHRDKREAKFTIIPHGQEKIEVHGSEQREEIESDSNVVLLESFKNKVNSDSNSEKLIAFKEKVLKEEEVELTHSSSFKKQVEKNKENQAVVEQDVELQEKIILDDDASPIRIKKTKDASASIEEEIPLEGLKKPEEPSEFLRSTKSPLIINYNKLNDLQEESKPKDEQEYRIQKAPIIRLSESNALADIIPESEEVPVRAKDVKNPLRTAGRPKLEGPTGILSLNTERKERITSTIDLLFKKDLGWYRHLFGMRLFVPNKILGVDPEIEAAWEDVLEGVREDFKMPLMRLMMPKFEVNQQWSKMFGTKKATESMGTILEAMPSIVAMQRSYHAPNFREDDLYGTIGNETLGTGIFKYFEGMREPASIHHVNALIPEMIPDNSKFWLEIAEALKAYKKEIASHFKAIVYMDEDQRHERMTKAPSTEMDEALNEIKKILKKGGP